MGGLLTPNALRGAIRAANSPRRGSAGFTPRAIPALALLPDPSDATTLFSDFIGTIAEADDTVALMLDKSQGAALGADLVDTANTAAAWTAGGNNTVEDDSGEVKITYVDNATGADVNLDAAGGLSGNLTAKKAYEVTASARVDSGSQVSLSVISSQHGNLPQTVPGTTNITFTWKFIATGNELLRVSGMGAGEVAWVSAITVKEIAGNHAWQDTAGSRAALRVAGDGTRYLETDGTDDYYNLPVGTLTYSGSISCWTAIAIAAGSSESYPLIIGGDGGASPSGFSLQLFSNNEEPRAVVSESGTANAVAARWTTALTDDDPAVIAALWEDAGTLTLRVSGTNRATNTPSYAALDTPTRLMLFGDQGANNIACKFYGAALYNDLIAGSNIGKLDAFYADKSGDTI